MKKEVKPAIEHLIDWLSQYEGKMVYANQVILEAKLLVKKEWEEVQNVYSVFFDNKNK